MREERERDREREREMEEGKGGRKCVHVACSEIWRAIQLERTVKSCVLGQSATITMDHAKMNDNDISALYQCCTHQHSRMP